MRGPNRQVRLVPQQQTKKAATFEAIWRTPTHPYVSGSDVKNVLWDRQRWPHHDGKLQRESVLWRGASKYWLLYPTKSNFS